MSRYNLRPPSEQQQPRMSYEEREAKRPLERDAATLHRAVLAGPRLLAEGKRK